MIKKLVLMLVTFAISSLQAEDPASKFEGVLGNPVDSINNMNSHAHFFLRYNPIIVEIGAYDGTGTAALSKDYPYGKIFAFEPHPNGYRQLLERVESLTNVTPIHAAVAGSKGNALLFGEGPRASLLSSQEQGDPISVPTVTLNESFDKIDFLRLDAGGLEWEILQSAQTILPEVLVIVTKTHMEPSHPAIPSYLVLKQWLEMQGFELLSHWYREGGEGEATFIQKYLYNSIFR